MQFNIYALLGQFAIYFFHQYHIVNANPIIGINVRQAKQNEFPFVVSVMRINNEFKRRDAYQSCVGSLISNRDVLTAAHCLDIEELHPIQVIAGSIDIKYGKKYSVAWWITYNEWNLYKKQDIKFKENDIGIIRLSQNVSDEIKPAFLLSSPNFDVTGLDVQLAGWGISNTGNNPMIMETVSLKTIKSTDCEKRISKYFSKPVESDERFLCTVADPYALIHFGDSGGPLIYRGRVIAINKGTCPYSAMESQKVNLHVAINYYRNFIDDIIDRIKY